MFTKVYTCCLQGIEGHPVVVETDVSQGLPGFEVVGLPDATVKEARERVRAAIKNCGYEFPARRFTVNLAPADMKKQGSMFDLPIAAAILFATGQAEGNCEGYVLIGELSLAGELRPVPGVLPLVMGAAAAGIKNVIVPAENAEEGALCEGVHVFGAPTLAAAMDHLTGKTALKETTADVSRLLATGETATGDFAEVKGQENVKRALEIAAAGGHNILIVGSPGSGKSMLAQRLPSILPPLTVAEALEVTRIHSVAGVLPAASPLMTERPFRAPHHSASTVGLTGGGNSVRPGEISLAHRGVLFLDELPEFRRDAMEVLRQPMEDGNVTVTRAAATHTYPSDFMLVAAMNPCRCGYYGDESRRCRCTSSSIARYLGKISGPLLDRIDIRVEAETVTYSQLSAPPAESSAQIRERVTHARALQAARLGKQGLFCNAQLSKDVEAQCSLTPAAARMAKEAFTAMQMTARSYTRVLKVARTIADLESSEKTDELHIAEAFRYHLPGDRLTM